MNRVMLGVLFNKIRGNRLNVGEGKPVGDVKNQQTTSNSVQQVTLGVAGVGVVQKGVVVLTVVNDLKVVGFARRKQKRYAVVLSQYRRLG